MIVCIDDPNQCVCRKGTFELLSMTMPTPSEASTLPPSIRPEYGHVYKQSAGMNAERTVTSE